MFSDKRQIVKIVRLVFIFGVLLFLGGAISDSLIKPAPHYTATVIFMIVGTFIVVRGSKGQIEGRIFESRKPMTGTSFIVILGAFMAAKLISMVPAAAIISMTISDDNAEVLQGMLPDNVSVLMSFIFLGICTPICEELVFRGCVGNVFRKYGAVFGMVMSSLLFAMYHMNLFQLISTFLPGIVLYYVAMNYSIKWSMLLHFINNGVLAILLGEVNKQLSAGFFTSYNEYIIEGILVILAIVLMKKDKAVYKVKEFLSAPDYQKGAAKAAIANIWFIIIAIVLLGMTASIMAAASGVIPM